MSSFLISIKCIQASNFSLTFNLATSTFVKLKKIRKGTNVEKNKKKKRNMYETKLVNIVNNWTRDDETKYDTCGHPLCFELVHIRTQKLVLYIIYTSIYTAISNDSPIANCRSFPISEFPPENYVLCLTPKLTSWKLQLLWTMVNISQNQKRTKELGRVQWDLCLYILISGIGYMYLAMSPIGFRSNMRLNKKFLLICCLL